MRVMLLALFLSVWTSSLLAHQPSTAYLNIDSSQTTLSGSWDIPLIDLQLALELDLNQNRQINWGEITQREKAIALLAKQRISLIAADLACDLEYLPLLANKIHGDGYVHLRWTSNCEATGDLSLNYQLFSDENSNHRALLKVDSGEGSQSYVIRQGPHNQDLTNQGFVSYFYEGVIHIWIGYDHLLFLLLLLLPLIATNWKQSVKRSLWLITAFTVAHSLSLVAVTLGNLSLPVKLVELSISLSIVGAAGLLIWRPDHRASAALALALGLLHGLGFANVLRELLANGDNLALHLFGFNLGVEAGQLAIAGVAIPLLILIQQRFNYAVTVRALALISLAIASYWTIERL